MKGFIMNNDSAIRICNSVYSIMLGFTVNNMLLLNKDWTNYSATLTPIAGIIMAYYIIDWFSFNALATIDETQESVEIFLAISFVIYLGWLMVFANNISTKNINSFIIWVSIYLSSSTLLFILRLGTTMKEKWKIDLAKDRWVIADIAFRIFIGMFGLFCSANRHKGQTYNFDKTNTVIIVLTSFILFIKIVRYLDIIKLIKEKETPITL